MILNKFTDQLGFPQRIGLRDECDHAVVVFSWNGDEWYVVIHRFNHEPHGIVQSSQFSLMSSDLIGIGFDEFLDMSHLRFGHTGRIKNWMAGEETFSVPAIERETHIFSACTRRVCRPILDWSLLKWHADGWFSFDESSSSDGWHQRRADACRTSSMAVWFPRSSVDGRSQSRDSVDVPVFPTDHRVRPRSDLLLLTESRSFWSTGRIFRCNYDLMVPWGWVPIDLCLKDHTRHCRNEWDFHVKPTLIWLIWSLLSCPIDRCHYSWRCFSDKELLVFIMVVRLDLSSCPIDQQGHVESIFFLFLSYRPVRHSIIFSSTCWRFSRTLMPLILVKHRNLVHLSDGWPMIRGCFLSKLLVKSDQSTSWRPTIRIRFSQLFSFDLFLEYFYRNDQEICSFLLWAHLSLTVCTSSIINGIFFW